MWNAAVWVSALNGMHLFVGHEAKLHGRPLDRFLLQFLFISARQAALQCSAIELLVSIFWTESRKSILFGVGGIDRLLRWEQFWQRGAMTKKKKAVCQLNIYSRQMLPTRVFVFHQCQSNHGAVFQASVITPWKREEKKSVRAVEWERQHLRMWYREWQRRGKMRLGKGERLGEHRQTDGEGDVS